MLRGFSGENLVFAGYDIVSVRPSRRSHHGDHMDSAGYHTGSAEPPPRSHQGETTDPLSWVSMEPLLSHMDSSGHKANERRRSSGAIDHWRYHHWLTTPAEYRIRCGRQQRVREVAHVTLSVPATRYEPKNDNQTAPLTANPPILAISPPHRAPLRKTRSPTTTRHAELTTPETVNLPDAAGPAPVDLTRTHLTTSSGTNTGVLMISALTNAARCPGDT